ncbi:MAG TPA: hypothetical protein VIB48_10525 [Acidimicrobiia bacterium]|jgi:hypothetical protein
MGFDRLVDVAQRDPRLFVGGLLLLALLAWREHFQRTAVSDRFYPHHHWRYDPGGDLRLAALMIVVVAYAAWVVGT